MMEAPTLSRFLLRSRALWLTVFTLVFLSWAWWDSEYHRTNFSCATGAHTGEAFSTYDGGFSIGWDFNNPTLPSGFQLNRQSKFTHPVPRKMRIENWGPPDISYLSPMIIVSGICALYLCWRWYLIRRESSAT
jgi:hypothetical protein